MGLIAAAYFFLSSVDIAIQSMLIWDRLVPLSLMSLANFLSYRSSYVQITSDKLVDLTGFSLYALVPGVALFTWESSYKLKIDQSMTLQA